MTGTLKAPFTIFNLRPYHLDQCCGW